MTPGLLNLGETKIKLYLKNLSKAEKTSIFLHDAKDQIINIKQTVLQGKNSSAYDVKVINIRHLLFKHRNNKHSVALVPTLRCMLCLF